MGQKIATCSYCGTRAALSLHGKVQHETRLLVLRRAFA